MKFILTFLILALPCILFAQNNSTYDKDGKVKSVEQRRLEESQKKTYPSSASYTGNYKTSSKYRESVRKALKKRRKKIAAEKKRRKR